MLGGNFTCSKGDGSMRRFAIRQLALMLFMVVFVNPLAGRENPAGLNRLANEASPYLRQHADNPIDWYPWGEEALAKAKAENKPIFLSVGYSTCYWCHVMEKESFENEDVAAILNKHFIAIKVDRESRPDIDEIYMLATQLLTKRGGWPNSVFLTPSGEPFYAGTYFPRDEFMRILDAVVIEWRDNRPELEKTGASLAAVIRRHSQRKVEAASLTGEAFSRATKAILETHDNLQGGFGQAPKFPREPVLLYLLQLAAKSGPGEILDAVSFSLDAMARGGINDQVGGGFHRYSVDNGWLVPHFEKMLYNQAQLARAYVKAYALTGRADFLRTTRQILDYVIADMRSPEGGFYSARDAGKKGKEGVFYVWTIEEIKSALKEDEARLVIDMFGLSEHGNFEGSNILYLEDSIAEWAGEKGKDPVKTVAEVDAILARLAGVRAKRKPPHRDEKIITAWNGMMITAFAEAGEILRDKRYIDVAEKAAQMIMDNMHKGDGALWRILFDGQHNVDGQQEDYAYLAQGLIALFDVTGKKEWLEKAQFVSDAMISRFLDAEAGDFYLTEKAGSMGRPKLRDDGAIASGNSVALDVLSRLSRRSDNPDYEMRANDLLAALSGMMVSSPNGYAYALRSADALLNSEAGVLQYAGNGVLRAKASLGDGGLKIQLELKDKWHINANRPLEPDFIATILEVEAPEGWKMGKVEYPEPVERKLEFNIKPMALYEGSFALNVPVLSRGKTGKNIIVLKLRAQACSDKICLEPETISLFLPVANSY